MKKIIHHIRHVRQQPEEVKRHILHILTGVFAVILISLWIYSLGTSFTDTGTEAKITNSLAPFSALKENLVGGYKSITE